MSMLDLRTRGIGARIRNTQQGSHKLLRNPTNTPRNLRARIQAVPVGRKQRKSKSAKIPASPPSPNQEATFNQATGRMALGPWAGPYEPCSGEPGTQGLEVLYMDSNGHTHFSLESREKRRQAALLAAAGRPIMELAIPSSKLLSNSGLWRRGGMPPHGNKEVQRSALWTKSRGSRAMSTTRQINQARKLNN